MINDQLKAKRWLRDLRQASGLTQKQLGELVGRDTRVILNAESETSGWPGGFTLLRMLQELGVVEDAPAPADSPLARLEEKVDEALSGISDLIELLHEPPGESDAGAPRGSP